jgi:hypothetical protein
VQLSQICLIFQNFHHQKNCIKLDKKFLLLPSSKYSKYSKSYDIEILVFANELLTNERKLAPNCWLWIGAIDSTYDSMYVSMYLCIYVWYKRIRKH